MAAADGDLGIARQHGEVELTSEEAAFAADLMIQTDAAEGTTR
jgi:hypothetical protein